MQDSKQIDELFRLMDDICENGDAALPALEQYLQTQALDFSPIKVPEGNIEYLLYLQKKPEGTEMTDGDMDVDAVVGQAHGTLDK